MDEAAMAAPRVTLSAPFQAALEHGGRLAAAMAAYPRAEQPWLDLSTGINPDPWTGARASLEKLSRLPDPAEIAELEAVAARAFGVADPTRVVATAGAEAGLRWLARLLPVASVDIVSPTYGGHEAAWRQTAAAVQRISPEALSASPAGALVLVNPNNPDGRVTPRDDLRAVAEARAAREAWTIVDESFVETDPDLSVAGIESDRLIVLRSFGKFYGLAGVRLGFVVAPPELARRLRAAQGDWPVSADAVAMGTVAYADTAWQDHTRADLDDRAREFDGMLARARLRVVGGTSLFRLTEVADAGAAFHNLCDAGVLTRPFAEQPGWLRFGLPRAEDIGRLSRALRRAAP